LDHIRLDLLCASLLAPFCRRSVGFVLCSHRATTILNLNDVRLFQLLGGCVTNGEDWRFFLFVQNELEEKGRFLILNEPLKLGRDLTGLPLLMDLLHEWVSVD